MEYIWEKRTEDGRVCNRRLNNSGKKQWESQFEQKIRVREEETDFIKIWIKIKTSNSWMSPEVVRGIKEKGQVSVLSWLASWENQPQDRKYWKGSDWVGGDCVLLS